MSIHKKILEIMQEVKSAPKEGKIAFGSTKYNFIADDDLTPLIREKMVEKGIIMFPVEACTNIVEIKGSPLSVTTQRFCFVDVEDGSGIEVETVGQGYDSADKGSGKSMTNARKYAILQTFMLNGDDPDKVASDAYHQQTKPASQPAVAPAVSQPAPQTPAPSAPLQEGKHTIGFGKYKGQFIEDVVVSDRNYVEYLARNRGDLQTVAQDLLAS